MNFFCGFVVLEVKSKRKKWNGEGKWRECGWRDYTVELGGSVRRDTIATTCTARASITHNRSEGRTIGTMAKTGKRVGALEVKGRN